MRQGPCGRLRLTVDGEVRYAHGIVNTCFFRNVITVSWFTLGVIRHYRFSEAERSRKLERDGKQEDRKTTKSSGKSFEALFMKDLPSQQIDELKSEIFTYVVIAPLLSALFADKIDSVFVVCLLFVGIVGTALVYFRNRLRQLEESLKEQERRLVELTGVNDGIND